MPQIEPMVPKKRFTFLTDLSKQSSLQLIFAPWRAMKATYRRLIIWCLGYDFFISYCHESETYATGLYDSLSKKHVCFLDRAMEGIQAGQSIGDSISRALRRSRILVVVSSPAVAKNEWPRAECRFFSAVCPDRRLIPISPYPYSSNLPKTLFCSDLPALQEELQRWIHEANSHVPESFLPDDLQLAIVESELEDLRGATPSSKTLIKLHESHDGTSVPAIAKRIVCALSIAMLVLGGGFGMYYAAGAATKVVGLLQKSPYGTTNISEAPDVANADRSLRVSIRREHIEDAARANKLSVDQEWTRLRDLLDEYQSYRWWSTLGFGYRGIALELHDVADLIPKPEQPLPSGIIELRLYADNLSSVWVRQLGSAKDTKLLSVSATTLDTPEQLCAILRDLRVSELRLSKCGDFTQAWFSSLNRRTLSQLTDLRLTKLPGLVVQSRSEEEELKELLLNCPQLKKLTLDELSGCRFSSGFFPNLLQSHSGLCNHGTIRIDPKALAGTVGVPPECSCEIKLLNFEDL